MKSNWMDKQVSLYSTHAENTGTPATFREVLLSLFARDIKIIIGLRNLERGADNYKSEKSDLKSKLQCFTPAALLETKAKDQLREISRTGIMQLDFDNEHICDYDIDELKQAVYSLPFIAFCGLSCSGDGFYALALIAEPERLADYAEHCFEVLKSYGIRADESKGKKPENLRYVSYDCNMLIRDNPEVLKISQFRKKQPIKTIHQNFSYSKNTNNSALVNKELAILNNAQVGERWPTVQQVAFTLGGLNTETHLYEIINTIRSNSAFHGQEDKYIKCARDCFYDGMRRPLQPSVKYG